ncbi:MAG: hypothetical protein WD990_12345 [Acidimicrobiia bacterium]
MAGSPLLDLTETLERVLEEPRFDAPAESWWDRFVERALSEVAHLFAAVIDAVGGPIVAAFGALGIVGVLSAFVAFRLAGRRAALLEDRLVLERLLEEGADPAVYLRDADAASREGDHARAVRLRFIGGVLDMARHGRIRYEAGLTTDGIARQIADPEFDVLAAQFDAVAYGGEGPGAAGDARSRQGWDAVRAVR